MIHAARHANVTETPAARRAAFEARNAAMYAAWKDGASYVEVARRFGLGPSYTRRVVVRMQARERAAERAPTPPRPKPRTPAPRREPPSPTLAAERAASLRRQAERDAAARRRMRARQLLHGQWNASPDALDEAARMLWPHFGAEQLAEVVADALEMQRTERRSVQAEVTWTPPEREPRFGYSDRDVRAWDGIFADSLGARPVVRKAREG